MPLIVGLDIGGSTTKIVAVEKGAISAAHLVRADDPVTSAYGALGRFLNRFDGMTPEIARIMLTGVGQGVIADEILNIPACPVDEMEAIGRGGLALADRERAVVVSMGTGTAVVWAEQTSPTSTAVKRLFGSGVGGGTLLGLSRSLLGTRDFLRLEELAAAGNLHEVDLTVGDIAGRAIAGLASDITASNFGRVHDACRPEDLAIGILNLVFQTIGSCGALAARQQGCPDCVFTGNLSQSLIGRGILATVCQLYGVNCLIPERAAYATAYGAALTPPAG
ncbi:MAG: pantothenate kinase [Bacillota bacterium]|nr:pantothenate kinase [Bacillota bacterium]